MPTPTVRTIAGLTIVGPLPQGGVILRTPADDEGVYLTDEQAAALARALLEGSA